MERPVSTIEQLKHYVDVPLAKERKLRQIAESHPLRVTPYYVSLIDWNDPDDPIRKMAIPSLEEASLEGSYDTSGEAENTALRGLQHKYAETVLILATSRCATYCRHCFRKRLVGLETAEIVDNFEGAISYIRQHKEVNNVLISGGDPLILPNSIIEKFLSMLADISHLNFIRFGSRAPVTCPSRFGDKGLLDILAKHSKPARRIYVVTQFNHPKEITNQAIHAVDNLIQSGIVVDNQAVLLQGVNDDSAVLGELQNRLVGIGVIPYYVFQCRPVKRVIHCFQVPICRGIEIVEGAKARCNGHSKRFKYIMSHKTGKIEILGIFDDDVYFKYHRAKNRKNLGRIFKREVDEKAGWLDDFKPSGHRHEDPEVVLSFPSIRPSQQIDFSGS